MNWKERYATPSDNDLIEVGDIVYDEEAGDYGLVEEIQGDCDDPDQDEILCHWADSIENLENGEFSCHETMKRNSLEVYIKRRDR